MFGIETYEILLLIRQLGFSLAGAAALWGVVFSVKDFHCGDQECLIYDWIASKLFYLIAGGTTLGGLAYIFLGEIAWAHEGVVVEATIREISAALTLTLPIVIVVTMVVGLAWWLRHSWPKIFDNYMTPLYIFLFICFFVLTALNAWNGEIFSRVQMFYFAHGFHSIFTLGTVLVLDFLFLLASRSRALKEHLFPLFPTISKVVWVGLAFDFAAALLIIEFFEITEKFLFMQTVIGILIINGVFLSGPLTKKMLAALQSDSAEPEERWQTLASLAGTVSVTSWVTITTVDFFADLTINYTTLLIGYVLVILALFVGHELIRRLEESKEPPLYIH